LNPKWRGSVSWKSKVQLKSRIPEFAIVNQRAMPQEGSAKNDVITNMGGQWYDRKLAFSRVAKRFDVHLRAAHVHQHPIYAGNESFVDDWQFQLSR
jgi:hypothetical protein